MVYPTAAEYSTLSRCNDAACAMKARNTKVLSWVLVILLAACDGQHGDASAQIEVRAMAPASPMPLQLSAASGTVPEAEMVQVRQQLAELHREIAELRKQLLSPRDTVKAADSGPDPRHDPAARAEADRVEQGRVAVSETAFRTEGLDARWSQSTAAAMRAALSVSDETVRDHVRSVECRSQTCRVEISADAGATLEQDMPVLIGRLGNTLSNVTAGRIDQGDGRQATVLYFSR